MHFVTGINRILLVWTIVNIYFPQLCDNGIFNPANIVLIFSAIRRPPTPPLFRTVGLFLRI